MIDDTADLVISSVAVNDADEVPFVRFHSLDRDTVRAEAASNALLGEHFQLTPAELAAMEELGWRPPSSDGQNPTANFWVEMEQERSRQLAEVSVAALRDVYGIMHPVFLAPDQLAEILTPRRELGGSTEFDLEDVVAIVPVNFEHLDDMVAEELEDMFGHPPVRDSEGDFAIRIGSTMLFLRASDNAREVKLFASVVHDVEGRSRAMEVLNDLNTEARGVKFILIRDRVFATMTVLAHPFVRAHLQQAVRHLGSVADSLDTELATKLRGRTTFEES